MAFNFEFRVPPRGGERSGRFYVPSTGTAIPIGAPIGLVADGDPNVLGLAAVNLVTGATAPISGKHGILVYEYKNSEAYAGVDPFLTTNSDLLDAPLGAAVQMVSGPDVKVCFRNTEDSTFLNTRSYEGRTFVAGIGATPTVVVGDYLTPGTGDSTSGFWAENATASNAWFVVTRVDLARHEVEARMTF